MIEIVGTLKFEEESSVDPSQDNATRFIRQIAHDAVYGTFAEFPSFWRDKWERLPRTLVADPPEVREQTDRRNFTFTLRLAEDQFSIESAGLQHLIGVLAGDLFYLSVPGFKDVQVQVDEVRLPTAMHTAASEAFRDERAHSIQEIRRLFELGDEPFLAFSFKPRVGIRFEELKTITLGVLRAGFHLVELDTRNLSLDEQGVAQQLELAQEAADLSVQHVTRFSPNLSVPAPWVTELTQQFLDIQPDPVVVKIDGGLDGISSCQAVRRLFSRDERNAKDGSPNKTPIITCYPLLRSKLADLVPPEFYVNVLVMSGVDIIYLGGRPNFDSPGRTLGTEKEGRLIGSVAHYRDLMAKGWPMPTVAGGVYAGELHTFYELLGPKVAFFLGGGVALHAEGPIEGARLCADVVKEAVDVRNRTPTHEVAGDLNGGLIRRIERAYNRDRITADVRFTYISPSTLINATEGLTSWPAVT